MKEVFNQTLIHIGKFELKISSVIIALIFFILVFIFLKIIKKLIFRIRTFDLAKKYAIYSLIKYFTLVFAFVIGLKILNFNISVLIAGSAALLVGIGLGLQNLFSDFVSGIILLADSSVKVHDIIEVNGLVCEVEGLPKLNFLLIF